MNDLALSDNPRLRMLYQSMTAPDRDTIPAGAIRDVLARAGLREDDPRLEESMRLLDQLCSDNAEQLDETDFLRVIRPGALLLDRTFKGQLVIPDFQSFVADLGDLFEQSRANTDGEVASYIPKLAGVDPEQFGLAVCTVDGQRASFGDANVPFSAQCTHKPISYALALEEHGAGIVHQHMGREPSGQSFNEVTLNADGRPHNPMLNAGAIMCNALIRPDLDLPGRLDYVIDTWRRLAGGQRPGFDITTYLSERRTADRNFALAYFMREHGAFPEGSDLIESLEFYLQSCSLEVTAELVSVIAATLAAGGLCPLTGERVFQPETVRKALSFMSSCGMYDFSGEWAFRIGLPAKSGVSGVVMVVVPGVTGLCLWSPRLDSHGNSIRAIDFCDRLVRRFNFHHFDVIHGGHLKVDPRMRPDQEERDLLVDLCWAASEGDLDGIRRLIVQGADLDAADYDGRTALHLAASEGREQVVAFLLHQGVNPSPVDRWSGTPLDDARRGGHTAVADLLTTHAAPSTEAA